MSFHIRRGLTQVIVGPLLGSGITAQLAQMIRDALYSVPTFQGKYQLGVGPLGEPPTQASWPMGELPRDGLHPALALSSMTAQSGEAPV